MAEDVRFVVRDQGRIREATMMEAEEIARTLPRSFFRELSPEEEKEFRAWAQDNFEPDREPSPLWHPVVHEEWARLKEMNTQLRKEGYPGGKHADVR